MRAAMDDLGAATKYLDDAVLMARNAATLLERISEPLAEDSLTAARLLDETRHRTRRAQDALESV